MQTIRDWFNPWVFIASAAIAAVLLILTLFMINLMRNPAAPSGVTTAIVSLMPAPTLTPVVQTPTPPHHTPTATSAVPPSPIPGVIMVGAYVQVSGTGTDGLRLRAAPGLEGEILRVALESEVFRIEDGPRETDGYTWWYLVGPYDEAIHGWAVSNYLAIVQNP